MPQRLSRFKAEMAKLCAERECTAAAASDSARVTRHSDLGFVFKER